MPGYKYYPMSHAVTGLPHDHPYLAAAGFAKQSLAVTAHKDDEQRATSVLDQYDPGNPATTLDNFIDGDSLRNTDIVMWATVGVQHLPVTEDAPLVTNFETGFALRPHNYFSENAAMDVSPKKTDYAMCAPQKADFTYPIN